MRAIATGGALAIIGSHIGEVKRIKSDLNRKSINTEDLCIRHGIIHQPNLRAKLIKFNVMVPVVFCINFIEGRTDNFKNFLVTWRLTMMT